MPLPITRKSKSRRPDKGSPQRARGLRTDPRGTDGRPSVDPSNPTQGAPGGAMLPQGSPTMGRRNRRNDGKPGLGRGARGALLVATLAAALGAPPPADA